MILIFMKGKSNTIMKGYPARAERCLSTLWCRKPSSCRHHGIVTLFDCYLYLLNGVKIPADTPEPNRPKAGSRVLCLHPFEEQKRVYVVPSRVENLHTIVWNGKLTVLLSS